MGRAVDDAEQAEIADPKQVAESLAKAGRPTKRSSETDRVILQALRAGMTYDTAAKLAGIIPDTLRRWRRDDDRFSAACEQAKADVRVRISEMIVRKALGGDLDAAKFYLSHRTHEYQPKAILAEESEAVRRQREHSVRKMTQEEVARLQREREEGKQEGDADDAG